MTRKVRNPRSRRIIHQIQEKGTARLLCDEDFSSFRGVLLNNLQDTFSIHAKKMESRTELQICEELRPTTSDNLMQITIIECETGEKYEIANIPIQLIEHVNSVTGSSHTVITIDHPAIKFSTEEVLIGNRADMEIRQFIDPKLSPDTSKKVLLGTMSLKLVAKEKTEPTIRRMSESTDLGDLVIDQTNDFLA